MTYTYDPMKMMDGGKDQMRFELQDIAVAGAQETCVLSDEEYEAIISKAKDEGNGWKSAKYKCLKAICMRMAYEVDFSADGLSLSFTQRYDRWTKMKSDLEAEMMAPTANQAALGRGCPDGGHYFHAGMNDNPRAGFAPGPFRDL